MQAALAEQEAEQAQVRAAAAAAAESTRAEAAAAALRSRLVEAKAELGARRAELKARRAASAPVVEAEPEAEAAAEAEAAPDAEAEAAPEAEAEAAPEAGAEAAPEAEVEAEAAPEAAAAPEAEAEAEAAPEAEVAPNIGLLVDQVSGLESQVVALEAELTVAEDAAAAAVAAEPTPAEGGEQAEEEVSWNSAPAPASPGPTHQTADPSGRSPLFVAAMNGHRAARSHPPHALALVWFSWRPFSAPAQTGVRANHACLPPPPPPPVWRAHMLLKPPPRTRAVRAVAVVERLLSGKAAINAPDARGLTPLHIAAHRCGGMPALSRRALPLRRRHGHRGHGAAAKALLHRGADKTLRSALGATALQSCAAGLAAQVALAPQVQLAALTGAVSPLEGQGSDHEEIEALLR
eukprot:SAG11_NODE_2786_length_2974_cov_3.011478_2_plen_407_part_00